MQQGPESIRVDQIMGAVRRRAWLVAVCLLVVAGAAYVYSKQQHKKYVARASLVFSNNQLSQQVAGLPSTNNDVPAQQASELELVKLGDMAEKTAAELGHGLTAGAVQGSLSIAEQGESGVVVVSATSTSPTLAASIANTYTRQFVSEQQVVNRQYFQSALAIVNKQIARLSRAQRSSAVGIELLTKAQTLRLLTELNYGNVQIAQEALPPTYPSSPNTKRNTAFGGFLGLLIGLGLAFLLERLDRRVKGQEDLEAIFDLPLLGAVPESAAIARTPKGDGAGVPALSRVDAEAFNLLRAHLRFFNVDRKIRRVLVASAGPGDGKTTVSLYLAAAAARAGSRALLIEADLRKPTLSERLSIQPRVGLVDVLIGASSLDEATVSVAVETAEQGDATKRSVDVLAAGSIIPPNPSELLESQAMTVLLDQAGSVYDFVVIDTPPLTAVSDAFPLLTKVDGVLVVSWVGRSRRDVTERLRDVLQSTEAPMLGVVANGARLEGEKLYAPLRESSPASSHTDPRPAETLVSAGRS